jgi:hypothetical protein
VNQSNVLARVPPRDPIEMPDVAVANGHRMRRTVAGDVVDLGRHVAGVTAQNGPPQPMLDVGRDQARARVFRAHIGDAANRGGQPGGESAV